MPFSRGEKPNCDTPAMSAARQVSIVRGCTQSQGPWWAHQNGKNTLILEGMEEGLGIPIPSKSLEVF